MVSRAPNPSLGTGGHVQRAGFKLSDLGGEKKMSGSAVITVRDHDAVPRREGRILIVDDEPTVRTSLSQCLQGEGYEVHCVATGGEGLEAWGRLQPLVTIVDVGLPDCNGLSVLARLQRPGGAVIMMSGIRNVESVVYALELGAVTTLSKPLDLEDVIAVVDKAVDNVRMQSGGANLRRPVARILLVDDNAPFRSATRKLIEREGYDVIEAENGRSALALLEEHNVNLVIIDMFMPDMNGMEASIHMSASRPEIPIIAISSGGFFEESSPILQRAREVGAIRTLAKPFVGGELLEVIDALLAARSPPDRHAI